MKRFAWILLIFALGMIALLTSCKVHDARYRMHDARYMMHDARYTMHDTARDSIREYVRDSMAIRVVAGKPGGPGFPGEHGGLGGLGCAPDTVFIDRWHTTYRDRWRVRTHTDTVIVTHTDTITIRAPVPRTAARLGWGSRFLRFCTAGFFILLLITLLRIYLRR